MPTISIVVPVLDGRAFLRDCLDSLCAQDDESIVEIIVVDRGSVDGTPVVAESVGEPVRLVRLPAPAGRAVAVAAGQEEAKGDTVLVLEARAVYAPDAVRTGPPALHPTGTTAFGRAAAAMAPRPASRPGRRSWRFMPDTPAGLARDAFARPSAPSAVLVAATAALAVQPRRPGLKLAVPLAHAAVLAVRAFKASSDPGVAPHRAFLAAEIEAWSGGLGWWWSALP